MSNVIKLIFTNRVCYFCGVRLKPTETSVCGNAKSRLEWKCFKI